MWPTLVIIIRINVGSNTLSWPTIIEFFSVCPNPNFPTSTLTFPLVNVYIPYVLRGEGEHGEGKVKIMLTIVDR